MAGGDVKSFGSILADENPADIRDLLLHRIHDLHTVMFAMRTVGTEMELRKSRSLPNISMPLSMASKFDEIVISETACPSLPPFPIAGVLSPLSATRSTGGTRTTATTYSKAIVPLSATTGLLPSILFPIPRLRAAAFRRRLRLQRPRIRARSTFSDNPNKQHSHKT